MLSSAIPGRFNIPFANGEGPPYIRAIPLTSQQGITPGAASLTDGFPPICFVPVGAGGIPLWGADLNGILQQITAWSQWVGAGGPVGYDSGFSSAIGGYPKGAMIAAAGAPGVWWVSLVENNTTNPDTGGAGWSMTAAPQGYYADTSPTANAIVIAPLPAPAAYSSGLAYRVRVGHTLIAGGATLDAGAGPVTVQNGAGGALVAGDFIGGQSINVVFDATASAWRVLSPTAGQLAGGGLVTDATTGAIDVNIHGVALKGSPARADEVMIWDTVNHVYNRATLDAVSGLAALSSNSFLVAYFNSVFMGS